MTAAIHQLVHPTDRLLTVYLLLLGAIASVLLQSIVNQFSAVRRARTESASYRSINLAGDWHAIWQARVHGQQVINTERLRINQVRNNVWLQNYEVSPENPEGPLRSRSAP